MNYRTLYTQIGHDFFYGDAHNDVQITGDGEQIQYLLRQIGNSWAKMGEQTPHWSVMANPIYLPENLTDYNKEHFYESGALDINATLKRLKRHGFTFSSNSSVLDFGCGVGRLGEHLTKYFSSYVGVDVSAPHLALAEDRLSTLGCVNFKLMPLESVFRNDNFGRFDLIISLLTLQHNPPPLIYIFLQKLIRSIAPNGYAYLQIPYFLHDYSFDLSSYIASTPPVGTMEMHSLPQRYVFDAVQDAGCRMVEVVTDGRVGDMGLSGGYVIYRPKGQA